MKNQVRRNQIFGAIGMVCGVVLIGAWFLSPSSSPLVSLIFPIAVPAGSVYYFFKKAPRPEGSNPEAE